MEFLYQPDFENVQKRYEAFWRREIIDRPPVSIILPKPDAKPFPSKAYETEEARWLDFAYRAEAMDHAFSQTDFLYDALPVAMPNLGPEIFSAWCGCPYHYGRDTTWTDPLIDDWQRDIDKARIDFTHPLFEGLIQFTQLLLERGTGKFIVGLTDFHPGGDHLAALRDPQNLATDLIDSPAWVAEMLTRSMPEYYAAYGVFYNMLKQAGMPISSWTPLINEETYYIPSNDFSCMISKEMFDEFFLPGIVQECKFYDRCIYHLDGPGALRHLDSLLAIPELDAVQWVFGAGNEGYHRWVEVYQRIQQAGKGIQMMCDVSELPLVFETLKPEGVWFATISGITDRETARHVVDRITAWR